MKTQLIMLNSPIIVSDEIHRKGDYLIHRYYGREEGYNKIIQCKDNSGSTDEWWNKIIAGLPELPQIDFNRFGEQLGVVNIEKLAKEDFFNKQYEYHLANNHLAFFKSGFKTAQKLSEKKFSLEDIREAIEFGVTMPKMMSTINKQIEDYCLKISQPKVFDIEVEMECGNNMPKNEGHEEYCTNLIPKITNNKIKITKIL